MCASCPFGNMSRRQFMATAGALTAAGLGAAPISAAQTQPRQMKDKVRICALLGNPGPADRGWDLSEAELNALAAQLDQVSAKLGNVAFQTAHVRSAEECAAFLAEAGNDAPVLVVSSGIGWLLRVMPPVLEGGRPAAVYSVPGSGHDWMYPPRWQREGHRVTLFSSSDSAGSLERAARLLRVPPMMQQSRVLLFPSAQGTPESGDQELVKAKLGADLVTTGYEQVEALLERLDEAAVEEEARRWLDGAVQVVEPNRDDVVKAARMKLALDQLVEQEQADAISVGGCMGWLERGFPCLAFTRLRDRGIPASCEGDMDSLWTMLLFQYAFNIPGFQGNNYFDTARNGQWTAHCTGPLMMDGPDGEPAPYLLRGHSEVHGAGVVPEVHYRIGQSVTRAKLINLNTILLSSGKIAEVPEKSTRACRTQVFTQIKDADKAVFDWGGGVLEGDMMTLLHRVLFYGDRTQDVRHLAHLMGLRVIEEG